MIRLWCAEWWVRKCVHVCQNTYTLHVRYSLCPRCVYQSQSQQSKCCHKGLPKHRRLIRDAIQSSTYSHACAVCTLTAKCQATLSLTVRKKSLFSLKQWLFATLLLGYTKTRNHSCCTICTDVIQWMKAEIQQCKNTVTSDSGNVC